MKYSSAFFVRIGRLALSLAGLCAVVSTAYPETQLDDVIVTATRNPTPLANFAGSISTISRDAIALTGTTHPAELLDRIAGADFQRGSGQESLTAIRSPVLTGAGSCGSFLFMEDSIPIRPVGMCNVNDLFEVNFTRVERIEVQRGPSGAIYGSSAMHGAVNVIPVSPWALPHVGLGVDVGENSYLRGDIATGYQRDGYAVGLVGNATHDGGWRDHSALNEQKLNLSYALKLADSTLDIRLASTHLNQDTAGYIVGLDAYRDPTIARSNPNPEAYRNARATRLWAHWNRPIGDAWSVDLRPYLRTSRMDFLEHFLLGKPVEVDGQDSGGLIATLRRTYGGGSQWLAGIDVERADSFLLEYQNAPTTDGPPAANAIRPAGKHYDYSVISSIAAAYVHWEFALSPTWRIVAGAREEYVHYDYDNHMSSGNFADDGTNPCGINGCLYQRPADRTDTFKTFTPKFGVTWTWLPRQSLYATAVRGHRAPEETELYRLQSQQTDAPLSAEHLDSIEVGARGQFFVLYYDIAAYEMNKDNVIFRDASGFNIDNGRTKHKGIEYEFGWSPDPTVDVAVAGTVARHTYEFSSAAGGGETIVAGNDIDTAPHELWNARLDWHGVRNLQTELEWQHVGAYWTDAANTHRYAGHNLLNFSAGWKLSARWTTILHVTNLMDRAYADRADVSFGSDRYFPGRGRAFFIEVRYEDR